MTRRNERYRRTRGRRISGSFLSLPHILIHHRNFQGLRAKSVKLLIDLAAQYNGRNNGDLCAPLSIMRQKGWSSNEQLFRARNELVERGFLRVSRQGGRNQCTLYAITWQPIDDCGGKLDINATTTAPHDWKRWTPPDSGST